MLRSNALEVTIHPSLQVERDMILESHSDPGDEGSQQREGRGVLKRIVRTIGDVIG